ncbi:putative ribonuclease H-like domain, reverse transcriptase zinc-binding domain-containing protein [Rosa chinensis]|uniref:Putative ribonuclease H-like domain, reverse transcriptase zinc-binding domain-containing protein n=1 Tax=Rosa chinensis TaxID=74649 RepID=A0A2P6PDH7_ROSCH|nr:putative ribonuclease H-like domain, reverse transcriptase zinc-binding domain-containing protein [Rosa chinensis]
MESPIHQVHTSNPSTSHVISPLLWKWISNLQTLPKIKLFLWKATHNILSTKANLFHRHIARSPLCPICNLFPETIEHVLFTCPWSAASWFAHMFSYKIPFNQLPTFDSWLSHLSSLPLSSEFYTHISFLPWRIWKQRCLSVFKHQPPNPIHVAHSAASAAQEFLDARSSPHPPPSHTPSDTSPPHISPRWSPPPPLSLKINTDASWHASSLSCGVAALVRDHCGKLVAGASRILKALSPLVAEALAISVGLNVALSLPDVPIMMESDSQTLVSSLCSHASLCDWKAANLISQARYVAQIRHVSWHWTSRTANRAADLVAGLVNSGKCPVNWVSHPPSSLSNVLLYDGLPCPH